MLGLGLSGSLVFAQVPVPPPEPAVRPLIADTYSNDADEDRIEDALLTRLQAARAAQQAAAAPAETQAAAAALGASVDVELVFNRQITQGQINAFMAMGGEISYVYKAVSYGWNGQIPLGQIDQIPAALGGSLVLIEESKPFELQLQLATQTGRVRPVWANNFAGVPAGIDGDNTITIGIIDSGVDGTHTDLNGRGVYWMDHTPDGDASPRDVGGHGTHVAGIATGTGDASGSVTATLFYTDSYDLTNWGAGSFVHFPVDIPAGNVTFESTATWLGGGTTDLAGVSAANGTTGYTSLSPPASGASPLAESNTFAASATDHYAAILYSNGSTVRNFAVANSITNYRAVGDGRNRFSGVAPGANWAAAKVFTDAGEVEEIWVAAALDAMVADRVAKNIKVVNFSLGAVGDPGLTPSGRQKVNSAVKNGIVITAGGGNDGEKATPLARETDDPGRAALVITVVSANDINQVTNYASHGVTSPDTTTGSEEDFKPDLIAPGGSGSYSNIMSVDSNTNDGSTTTLADQQPNDYANLRGASMAAPFVAGSAALVIDALQQAGTTWDHSSSQHSLYIKMLLLATATETNQPRQGSSGFDPTLERDTPGPMGFPVGKDRYEGYGMVNPDAAVEAALLTYVPGTVENGSFGAGRTARRAWARKVSLAGGQDFNATLTFDQPDFDLYLYSDTPSTTGAPVILASSANSAGSQEVISYTPSSPENGILVIKRLPANSTGNFVLSSNPAIVVSLRDDDGANSPSLEYTNNQTVDLILDGITTTPLQMMLSESPSFAGGSWVPYQNPTSFTFQTATEEAKTVYVQLTDGVTTPGSAGNISDSIELDTTQPGVNSVGVTPDPNNPWVDIEYDEPVDYGVLLTTNYAASGSTGSVAVQNVTHLTGNMYRLETADQVIGDAHSVTVSNVADLAGNLIAPASNTAMWTGVPVTVSRFELH